MKKMFIPFLLLLLCVACSEKPGYEITGTVNDEGLNGKMVYLYEYDLNGGTAIDSTQVEDGKFKFSASKDTPPVMAVIRFSEQDRKPVRAAAGENAPFSPVFVLENGKLQVTLDQESYVTGTPENDNLTALQRQLADARKQIMEIYPDFQSEDPEVVQSARDKYEQISNRNEQLVRDYISANNNKLTGGKLLYDFRHTLKEDERRAIIDRADATFVAAPGVDQVIEHLDRLSKVAVGQKFTDFRMEDINGDMRSLSDYVGKGKVVLIDFWASWCGPCRREMPNLVEAYNKYKNKDFEIVGISLDSTREAWEKGVKDLGITWPQLSDLQYWKNEGAALYGVNSIPHVVIVDKDGTIISKGLYGEELIEKLQEILD